MFWTMSSCDAGRREAKLVEGGGSAVRLGDSLAPWITFRSSATGSTVHVCYRFNGVCPRHPFLRHANIIRQHIFFRISNHDPHVYIAESDRVDITRRSQYTQSRIRLARILPARSTDEPFKEYREFEVDIRMIHTVAVDYGSSSRTLPEVAKTFSFIGDGIASEVRRYIWKCFGF